MPKNKKIIIAACVIMLVVGLIAFFAPDIANAVAYDSLIAPTDFDTAKADVKTTAAGVLGIAFTIMVIGLIMAVIFR